MRVDRWKISGDSRFWLLSVVSGQPRPRLLTVMMSVLDGGEGSTSGGRSERLRESGDLLPDDARERSVDGMVGCIVEIMDAECRRDVLGLCCVGWSELSSSPSSERARLISNGALSGRMAPASACHQRAVLRLTPPSPALGPHDSRDHVPLLGIVCTAPSSYSPTDLCC